MSIQNVKCPCGNSFHVETGGMDSFQCTCPKCQTDLEINLRPEPKSNNQAPPKRGTFAPSNRGSQANRGSQNRGQGRTESSTNGHKTSNDPIVECACGFKFKVATSETDYQCQCPKCQAMIQVGQPKPKRPAQGNSPIRSAVADPLKAGNLSQHVPQANPTYQPLQPKKIKKKKKPRPSAGKDKPLGCLWVIRLIITIKAAKVVVFGLLVVGVSIYTMFTTSSGSKATVKGVVPFDRESIEKSRESGGEMVFNAETIIVAVNPRQLNEAAYAAFRDSNAKGTVIEFGFDDLMSGSNVYRVNSIKVNGEWLMKSKSKDEVDPWVALSGTACCFGVTAMIGFLVVMSAMRLHREAKERR